VSRLLEVHHVYPEEGPGRPQAARMTIVVARGREDLIAAERALLGYCVGVGLALMALVALFTHVAVSRGLAPATRLASALDAVRMEALPARFDVGSLPAELAPVVDTTDALIRRVDAALERERRTAADIAHELRTPISELLTVSEVALRNGLDVTVQRKALGTVRDVAWRMGSSISTLLQLARLEHGSEVRQLVDVDLGAVVRDSLRPLAAAGRERALVVQNEVAVGERVEGNPEVLHIVTSNLLGNALYYSPKGGRVQCRVERDDGRWRLVVENDAPELAPEDLRSLSEPFWRKDRARTDRSRSGLGLALSCALAQRTGLELGFALDAGRFRAVLGPSR
jgi:two-component system sensor histidine kinase QseC